MNLAPFFAAAAVVPETAGAAAAAAEGARNGWPEQAVGGLVFAGLIGVALVIYLRLLLRVLAGRGRVAAAGFGPLEAGLAAGLAGLFIALIAAVGFSPHGATPEPSARAIVLGVLLDTGMKAALVTGLIVALGWRGLNAGQMFGFHQLGPGRAVLTGAGLLLAALPLVYAVIAVTQRVTGPDQGQEVVRLLAASRDAAPRLAMIVAAVVVAPVVEEFLFRGYLYGVMRRYLGAGAGLVLNSALFAGIHLHVPSLGGLFVLAACLTLAYEATGSLLVPMAMHALFNSVSVAALLLGFANPG